MDEEIDRLVVAVRADTQGFARDIGTLRQDLEGPLASGAEKAGKVLETTLARAVRTGKLGFEDLRAVALAALNEIARSALASGLSSLGLGSGGGTGGLGAWSTLGGVATAALGLPGRATGGPVSVGRAYRVGENGPELFVPTASGTVVPTASGGGRDVRVAIAVTAPQGTAPAALTRSARQIARTVRGALDR